jgi:hypothetical protein
MTALMIAAGGKLGASPPKVVQLLLDYGADVEARDEVGAGPAYR